MIMCACFTNCVKIICPIDFTTINYVSSFFSEVSKVLRSFLDGEYIQTDVHQCLCIQGSAYPCVGMVSTTGRAEHFLSLYALPPPKKKKKDSSLILVCCGSLHSYILLCEPVLIELCIILTVVFLAYQ